MGSTASSASTAYLRLTSPLVLSRVARKQAAGRSEIGPPLGHTIRPVWLLLVAGAPAALVLRTSDGGVGHGAHHDTSFELLVALDGGLAGAAVLLAPHDLELGAFGHVVVHGRQRQATAFVVAVAGEHRQADGGAVGVDHAVVVRRAVVGQRQVEVLVLRAVHVEQRAHDGGHVLGVPRQGDLLALDGGVDLLQRFTADEVVVELHEGAVAQLPRVEVVVLDVVRHEATGQRVGRFVGVHAQPLAVGAQLFTGVDRRQRRGDPARLQGVGGVGTGADRHDAELFALLEDFVAHLVIGGVVTPDLQTRRTSHTVTQGEHPLTGNGHLTHAEEADLLHRATVELLDDLPGVGTLDLETPVLAVHRLTHRARRRTTVHLDVHVIATGLTVEQQPVGGRGAADVDVGAVHFVEEDTVTDDVARRGGGHVLLGAVDREVGNRVDRGVGDELQGVLTADEQVVHVVGLVVQHRGVAPCGLFVAPVVEFRGHDRVDVGTDLGVTQELNGVTAGIQELLEVLGGHAFAFPIGVTAVGGRRTARKFYAPPSGETRTLGLLENDRLVTVADNPILAMPLQRPGEHLALDIGTATSQFRRVISMGDPHDVLFDDRALIEVLGHVVGGRTDELDAAFP